KSTLRMFGDQGAIQIAKELEDQINKYEYPHYSNVYYDFIDAITTAQKTSQYIIDTMNIK
ncbi:MAG: hypothetical protein ACQEUB_11460, partial [Thermodesulfobacteriota bacterium]